MRTFGDVEQELEQVNRHVTDLQARLDKAREALEDLAAGRFVGTSINKGCGAMRLIQDALEEINKP